MWRFGIFAKNAGAAITTPCYTGSSTRFRYASFATGVAEPKTQPPDHKPAPAPALATATTVATVATTVAAAEPAPSFEQQPVSKVVSLFNSFYYYYYCCINVFFSVVLW